MAKECTTPYDAGDQGKAKGRREVAKDTERREAERSSEDTRKEVIKVVERKGAERVRWRIPGNVLGVRAGRAQTGRGVLSRGGKGWKRRSIGG